MSKKTKRRIAKLYDYAEVKVRDSVGGKAEVSFVGDKLDVVVSLDEDDLRSLARSIRLAFKRIRQSRADANNWNFAALEQDDE